MVENALLPDVSTVVRVAGIYRQRHTTSGGLYALCGIGSAGSGLVATSTAVGKWFIRKRGLAIGLSTMGIGVGTIIMTPLAGYIE